MNTTATQNKSKNMILILFVFACALLFSVSGYSQSAVGVSTGAVVTELGNDVKQENVKTSNNLEFVLWFMGSKQDPNTTISAEGINTKKQIMTSGIAPNRLLIKAFLKKAVNFESSLA